MTKSGLSLIAALSHLLEKVFVNSVKELREAFRAA